MGEHSIATAGPAQFCRSAQDSNTLQDALDQAREEFLAGRLAQAELRCCRVLEQSPAHPAASRQLGLIRLVEGDPAGALTLLRPLRDIFPDDPDVGIALAEAEWAANSASAAIPHFRRALALAPGRMRVRTRLGLALLTAGQPGAARQELEKVAASQPGNASALTLLGMALLAVGDAASAASLLKRALRLNPADPASAFQLGQALRELGRTDEALQALREAVRRAPDQAYLRVGLADALFTAGHIEQALSELRQAVALAPSLAVAWAKLGDLEQLIGSRASAVGRYRRAAELAPDNPGLRNMLGNALFTAGDTVQAAAEFGRGMAAGWAAPARSGRLRVGIIAAPGAFNTPTDYIIDRDRNTVAPLFMLDGFDYPCGRIAAANDVLFNAVSDPDAAPGALALAARIAQATGLPVLNQPGAMFATARHLMAARLAGIDGVRVPPVRRHCRAAVEEEPAAALRDFAGPVLVRPVGSHGGHDLTAVKTAYELRQAAAAMRSDEVYLTGFVDFRSSDGLYRKLRLVFVGGRPFPVHLAIGDHWLVHYFRTAMAGDASLRAEEAAFLRRPDDYLGPLLCGALEEVQARVGLDYFGVDAAIDRDGRLVLFECNATMLVRHADCPAVFDYKRGPAVRIRDAMGELLHRAAARSAPADGLCAGAAPPGLHGARGNYGLWPPRGDGVVRGQR